MLARHVTQALGANLYKNSHKWKWRNTYSYLEVGVKAEIFTWLMFSKLTSSIEGQGGHLELLAYVIEDHTFCLLLVKN